MRGMYALAPILLVGLLAVTAQPVSALCMVDEDNPEGCAKPTYIIDLDVKDAGCADAADICIVDANQSLGQANSNAKLNFTIRNHLGVPLTFQVHAIEFADDSVSSDGSADRRTAAQQLLSAQVAAGAGHVQQIELDANVTKIRVQAFTSEAQPRHDEIDQEVLNYQILATGIGDPEPALEGQDDDAEDAASEDAPYLGIVAIVGVLAAIVGLRRLD